MDAIEVYLETARKRSFAGVLDWPGWCRGGRDEAAALQNLFEYGRRYAQVLNYGDIPFQPPAAPVDFVVTQRLTGNTTTDFGAPAIMPEFDSRQVDPEELERFKAILQACWGAFDAAVQLAAGVELRKGPRGGGRDLEKIIHHVYEADRGYLRRIAWKYRKDPERDQLGELERSREAILKALDAAVIEGLPERGPRGGQIWTPRYYVRRAAWHVLDHAWEIEDRLL